MIKKLALDLALKKAAPDSIPMSAPACYENDFFQIYINISALDWKFLSQTKTDKGYEGFLWVNDKNGNDAALLNETLNEIQWNFEITHYYQSYQFVYTNPYKFIASRLLFKHKLHKLLDVLAQSIYNKKTLVRSERMELLNYLVEKTIDDPAYSTDSMFLGMHMHSYRWYHHPKKKEHQAHFRLILDSLVESGDLKKKGDSYLVTGKALESLSVYENDQQKHQDNINNSRTAHSLTRALILVGSLSVFAQLYMWINRAS